MSLTIKDHLAKALTGVDANVVTQILAVINAVFPEHANVNESICLPEGKTVEDALADLKTKTDVTMMGESSFAPNFEWV